MIQRIQTAFLALALVAMGLLIWLPLGEIAVNEKVYSFALKGIFDSLDGKTIYPAWHLMVLIGVILFLQIVVIYTYKKRSKQIRIALVNIFLMLGFMVVCWLFVMSSAKLLGGGIYSLKIAFAFPLVSILFNYLAIKAIQRDEALVKSIDRIR